MEIIVLSDITIASPVQLQKTMQTPSTTTVENLELDTSAAVDIVAEPSFSHDLTNPSTSSNTKSRPVTPQFSLSTSTQTSLLLSRSTPRKEKLRVRLRQLQKQMASTKSLTVKVEGWNLEEFIKKCDIFLDEPLREVIKSHVTLKNRKPLGRRYSSELEQFALMLYFLSPKCYKVLSKVLTLPIKRCLQKITQQLSCRAELMNVAIFKALELKVKTLMDVEKHCILCLDEMSLKSNLYYNTGTDEIIGLEDIGQDTKGTDICKNVLVIMASGLYSSWKQPIAYFFVASQLQAVKLKPIMEECIKKLTGMGLCVEGIASDMGSNFIELANSFGVTRENLEFKFGDKNLIYIFDPCHLIKATRNNLLSHTFHFKNKKTS